MRNVVAWVAFGFALSLQAGASEPETPAATNAAPTAVSTEKKPETATQTAAPATANSSTAASEDKTKPFQPPPGYRKEKRNYGEVYCRNEGESGTRFSKKRCYSEEDLKAVLQQQKETSEELARSSRACGGGPACNSN